MKNYIQNKNSSQMISSVASMALFLMFTVCAVTMVSIAAATYSRISKSFDSTFNSSAAVRYISNKARACHNARIISGDKTILVLEETGFDTIIYYDNGGIYEVSLPADYEFDGVIPDGADLLFNSAKLMLENYQDSLMKISVWSDTGEVYSTYCQTNFKDENIMSFDD